MNNDSELSSPSVKLIVTRTDRDRLIVRLALDCKTHFDGNTEAGMKYMIKGLGEDISESTYYRYLHKLDEDPELHYWIEDQSKIGFVKNQRDMIEETLRLKALAIQELDKEIVKPDSMEVKRETEEGGWATIKIPNPEKNKAYISSLFNTIRGYNERLGELNLGSPIIANIKYIIDNLQKNQKQ